MCLLNFHFLPLLLLLPFPFIPHLIYGHSLNIEKICFHCIFLLFDQLWLFWLDDVELMVYVTSRSPIASVT